MAVRITANRAGAHPNNDANVQQPFCYRARPVHGFAGRGYGRELLLPWNVHNVSKNLLTNYGPLCVLK